MYAIARGGERKHKRTWQPDLTARARHRDGRRLNDRDRRCVHLCELPWGRCRRLPRHRRVRAISDGVDRFAVTRCSNNRARVAPTAGRSAWRHHLPRPTRSCLPAGKAAAASIARTSALRSALEQKIAIRPTTIKTCWVSNPGTSVVAVIGLKRRRDVSIRRPSASSRYRSTSRR